MIQINGLVAISVERTPAFRWRDCQSLDQCTVGTFHQTPTSGELPKAFASQAHIRISALLSGSGMASSASLSWIVAIPLTPMLRHIAVIMAKDLTIRPATHDQFDDVARVWHESAADMDAAASQMPSIADLRARIDVEMGNGWQLFVAERGARVVGILAIKTEQAVLDQIFVHPVEQRSGVGSALMAKAQQLMPSGFTLRMAKSNIRAASFYERSGFKCEAEGLHPSGWPVVFYRWHGR